MVSFRSLVRDDFCDPKFKLRLRFNLKYVQFAIRENGFKPEIRHDYLKALLEDLTYDDFYSRFYRVKYYLTAVRVFLLQKCILKEALRAAQARDPEDVQMASDGEPEFDRDVAELIERYRPGGWSVEGLVSKYEGLTACLGGVFGDVAGSRFEFFFGDRQGLTLEKAINQYSRVTDDSVLLLATLDAVKEMQRDPDLHIKGTKVSDFADTIFTRKYRAYYREFPQVGYGPGFSGWAVTDRGPYGSFGNGSAMRVAPIGELFEDVDEVILHAIASAACTHNHPEGIKGAVVTAVCVWMGRHGCAKDEILNYVKKHYQPQDLIKSYRMEEVRGCYQGGYGLSCQFSVPAAVTCFYESASFEECIENVLSFEGDSDTIACIAGAIAGAFYGVSENVREIVMERVPDSLRRLLKGLEEDSFMDEYDLERFVSAQACYYQTALQEVQEGCKRSHWMWYIFPQIVGLGDSWKAQKYSIADIGEAVAYMQHPVLGQRLVEISEAVLRLPEDGSLPCFGPLDSMKLRSCMTLFAEACPECSVFQEVLDQFYGGENDPLTLEILRKQSVRNT